MKGLIIKEPWVSLILSGEKTMEMRKTRTKIRGRIALLNNGYIRGYANLQGCEGPLDKGELVDRVGEHCVSVDSIESPAFAYSYGWILTGVECLATPQRYSHPRGAQMWVNLP